MNIEARQTRSGFGTSKESIRPQRFTVLATPDGGQPDGTLGTFAETVDIAAILFVTGRNTRKYSDAMASRKVAVVIGSRMPGV
jgi:hypothetical protein